MEDNDSSVVQSTLLALGELGTDSPAAITAITEATKSNNRAVKAVAGQALRSVAPALARELIGEAFDAVQARLDDIRDFRVGNRDWPQLGGSRFRNNTPAATDIPTTWNVGEIDGATGDWNPAEAVNIKWVAKLGSQSYGNPVVANDKIYVGTNNGAGYLERHPPRVDLGCLLCFRESDGQFLWQHSSKKLASGRVHDWPFQGICSSPVIEGDRLWFVTNRGEVTCLDTEGFYDGEDDGPETGVWEHLFDATVSLSPQEYTANVRGYEAQRLYLNTIRAVLGALDMKLPRYPHLRTATPHSWEVITRRRNDETVHYRLDLKDDHLLFTPVHPEANSSVEIGVDLLAGIEEGQVSTALRAQFAASGIELPPRLEVDVVAPKTQWNVKAIVDGVRQTFRLRAERSKLACYVAILRPLKDEADVIWKFNMMSELGVSQHNMATCGPTLWGDVLFVCTSNGVDSSHLNIPAPEAPSFIAIDKNTGEVLWTDDSPGKNILHGQWSCPAVGVFDGVPQVIFPGGDGWLYSFRADRWQDGKPELVWKFDCNPKESKWILGGRGTRNNLIAVPVIYDGLVYAAVGQDPEHGEGAGHLWCIDPKKEGDVSPELVLDREGQIVPHRRLQAGVPWATVSTTRSRAWHGLDERKISESLHEEFDKAEMMLAESSTVRVVTPGRRWFVTADDNGSETEFRLTLSPRNGGHALAIERKTDESVVPNPNSAVVWHYDTFDINGDGVLDFEEEMHRAIGSPTIKNDLLVITDFSGLFHCLNAKNGGPYWTCDLLAGCWSTPLVVQDKVFVGDEDGDVAIFDLSPDPTNSVDDEFLPRHEISMGTSVYQTPIAANNVLYIATKTHLIAIEAGVE